MYPRLIISWNCIELSFSFLSKQWLKGFFLLYSQEAPAYGADVLRLWVSSVDYTGDVMIGPQILRQMSEVYRKLRGTLRYLLANLHDWKVSLNSIVKVQAFLLDG